ncbi:MAG: hypothetical protein ICV78_16215 [Tolypothrix sp. Co-bin9]|nr:hypothetical protein [Tolypothrix sp. Co-bin9]
MSETTSQSKLFQQISRIRQQLYQLGQLKQHKIAGVAQICSLTPLIEPVHKYEIFNNCLTRLKSRGHDPAF